MAPQSPVVARWELSVRLAKERHELGLSVADLSKACGFTRNYWSQIVNNRTLVAQETLERLCEVLGVVDRDQVELARLRSLARQKGWWDAREFEDYFAVNESAKEFFGLEYGASRIWTYEGHSVPGLLQTEEYTRRVVAGHPSFNSELETDRQVKIRSRRRERLTGPDPVAFSAILSEAALLQQYGDQGVHRRQLEQLVDWIVNFPNVEVRVLPFAVNPGSLVTSSTLVFFDFETPHLPIVSFQEAIRLLDDGGDEEMNRLLNMSWRRGLKAALDPKQSLQFIERLAVDSN